MLKSQTELAKMINELPGTGDMLRAASAHPAPTTEQVEGDENRWAMAGPEDPLVREILSNDLARAWRSVQRDHPWFTEVIVTDVRGRLVAATGKPTHYRQASQKWWAEYQARRYDLSVLYLPPAITPRRRGAALMMNLYRPIWHGHTSAAVRPGFGNHREFDEARSAGGGGRLQDHYGRDMVPG